MIKATWSRRPLNGSLTKCGTAGKEAIDTYPVPWMARSSAPPPLVCGFTPAAAANGTKNPSGHTGGFFASGTLMQLSRLAVRRITVFVVCAGETAMSSSNDQDMRATNKRAEKQNESAGGVVTPMRADRHSTADPAVETPVEGRQGYLGKPVLAVLVGGLFLAGVAWLVVHYAVP